jgi:hypothetical protein
LKAHFGVDFGELKYPTMKPKGLRRPRRNPSSNTGRRNGGPSSLAFRRGIGRPAVGRVGDVAGELRFERGDGLVLALRAASTATMAAPAPVIGRARPEPLARTRSVPFTKEPADGIGPKESRREVIRLGIAAHHGPRARSARRDRARSAISTMLMNRPSTSSPSNTSQAPSTSRAFRRSAGHSPREPLAP